MRKDVDEPVEPLDEGPDYPKSVHTAGVIWLVFGALILIASAINLLTASSTPGGETRVGGIAGAIFNAFIGAVFVHVGVQSMRGTAKDTLGNGIGSLIFGLLAGGYGALLLLAAVAVGGLPGGTILWVLAGIQIICTVALLAAGILALVGRADYKAWRRAEKSRGNL
jgi:hypothetical protein